VKRAVALALASLFISAGVAQASTGRDSDATASAALVSVDSLYATVHVEQTGGQPQTLEATAYCNVITDVATFAGKETQEFSASADLTFYVGPRRYKGQDLTPNNCSVNVWATPREARVLASVNFDVP
jgi:hypothetical protein